MLIRMHSSFGSSRSIDRPANRMSPLSGSCNQFNMLSSVYLPDPEDPMTAAMLPAVASVSTSQSIAVLPRAWLISLVIKNTYRCVR